jgi:hypothetical protein
VGKLLLGIKSTPSRSPCPGGLEIGAITRKRGSTKEVKRRRINSSKKSNHSDELTRGGGPEGEVGGVEKCS